jgi:lipoprotein-anchoring transpeptidase ErfK/SrfK
MTNGENKDIGSQDSEMKDQNSSDLNVTADFAEKIRSFWQKTLADRRLMKVFRIVLVSLGSLLSVFLIFLFLFYLVPVIREIPSGGGPKMTVNSGLHEDQQYKKQVSLLQKDIQRLSRKFSSYTSGLSYIVINTTDNRFFLYRNKKLIRDGFCSSGSYTMLKTEGEQKWIFKTPKGKYRIQGKITSPVWRRPDWAFVEEGLPVPSANHPSRWEYGVLGDYALSIGDGYLIHGTLYKRFLGMPVTHGCVRLNDEDLEAIYHTLSVGSKVYIF